MTFVGSPDRESNSNKKASEAYWENKENFTPSDDKTAPNRSLFPMDISIRFPGSNELDWRVFIAETRSGLPAFITQMFDGPDHQRVADSRLFGGYFLIH
jgi:hypothetical protein